MQITDRQSFELTVQRGLEFTECLFTPSGEVVITSSLILEQFKNRILCGRSLSEECELCESFGGFFDRISVAELPLSVTWHLTSPEPTVVAAAVYYWSPSKPAVVCCGCCVQKLLQEEDHCPTG